MITVTFQAASLSVLKQEMFAFLGLNVPTSTQVIQPAATMVEKVEEEKPASVFAPKPSDVKPFDLAIPGVEKKRTRRTKEQIAADEAAKVAAHDSELQAKADASQEEHEESKAAPTETAAPAVSKEGVHLALQEVNVACGLNKAREILTEFKVNRISEIKEEDFAAFIAKCKTAAMMA